MGRRIGLIISFILTYLGVQTDDIPRVGRDVSSLLAQALFH